jgi:hypothetical protein
MKSCAKISMPKKAGAKVTMASFEGTKADKKVDKAAIAKLNAKRGKK